MAQTPLSTTVPYALAADMFVYHDPNMVADMVRDGSTARPTVAAMSDTSSAVGALLYRFMQSGAGRIESTCLVGKRYSPLDLRALLDSGTAASQVLIKLNCDVSFWQLCQRRQPNAADPRNVPGALEAFEYLQALARGDAVFGFAEAADAGLPSVRQANPPALLTPNVVGYAQRLFPLYGMNRLIGGED